ncbi:MAG: hypothetical protein ACFFCI_13830 [Promethearchaeota archaeon]
MDNSKKKIVLQIGNIIGFIATVIVNFLAIGLPINNKTTEELSDALPNLFVPIGLTFSIWSVIYILLGIFAIYQAKDLFKSVKQDIPFLDKISFFFILSSIANVTWIFLWHYELVLLSLIVMVILFLSLLFLYIRLRIGKEDVYRREKLFIHVPISVYFGWITTATIANVTAFLVSINWNRFGLTEEFWTILILIIAAIIYVLTVLTRRDSAYGLVGVWSTLGIFLKQLTLNPIIAYTALGVMIAIALSIVILIIFKKK